MFIGNKITKLPNTTITGYSQEDLTFKQHLFDNNKLALQLTENSYF